MLVPLTAILEGAPPSPTTRNLVGFAYLSLVGTALAFVLWFNGIRRLPAAAPPLLGLAAPITGAAVGWAVLGESLSPVPCSRVRHHDRRGDRLRRLTGRLDSIPGIAHGESEQIGPQQLREPSLVLRRRPAQLDQST